MIGFATTVTVGNVAVWAQTGIAAAQDKATAILFF